MGCWQAGAFWRFCHTTDSWVLKVFFSLLSSSLTQDGEILLTSLDKAVTITTTVGYSHYLI